MEFHTRVEINKSQWEIEPCEEMLFVGSCFAQSIGQRFKDELFRAEVNPYGVMYNPISVLHTVEKTNSEPAFTVVSLGTNRVYIDRETSLVVDNCMKRPANCFEEKALTVEECVEALSEVVEKSKRVILTISPIRYKKYGFHESQLAKAALLLAAEEVAQKYKGRVEYFPSYELVLDELRDYRFYAADMLHPSAQTVEYLFTRFAEVYFSRRTIEFLREWRPLREALAHRPINPESEEYKAFKQKTKEAVEAFKIKHSEYDIL